ncbi:retrovirus-related pol polyprotein from transposon TNT 1-94 [Tanacetum coccineum]
MAFMSTVMALRFPSTNNQLRTSSNLRNQATIQDERATVQQVQGRQGQSFTGTRTKGNATSSGGNNPAGQARVVKCYNCQGKSHMARQCTKPKRPRNSAWFKEKMLLVQAQESGRVLDEEQLAFLAEPGVADGQATQTIITHNVAFQTDYLDAYDSNCDDISSAKAVLMANLSSNDSNVLFEDIDSLKQTLSKHVKEKESLLQTFTVFEKESKEKENKYTDKEIEIKELDNIFYKVGQSAQTDHILTKPQVFYDDTHKQALGYQNPFYLKKAQQIKPTLYDGIVISKKHDVIYVVDEEETLILEEESRSKMLAKQNYPISKEKKINIYPINYYELNKLSEDFGNPEIDVPKELPKISLVFKEEAIPFINSLRASFKYFENGIHSELNEVKMIFNQMEVVIEQCFVDKKYFDIQKKELSLDNDRLLDRIICQDVINIVMHDNSIPVNVLPANHKLIIEF